MAKSNKLPLIVAAAVIVVVAAGTVLVRRSSDAPSTPDAGVAATGPAAGEQPPRRPGPAAATGSPAPGPERLERAQERRNQMREEYIARTAELKKNAAETFEREAVDPAWAPQKETDLQAIADAPGFETAGVAPQDLAIECKSSMCRVDGKFASNGEAEDWLLIYMSSVGGNMPNAVVSRSRNPDGSTRVQIYGRGR
jgi:hypothetical protein